MKEADDESNDGSVLRGPREVSGSVSMKLDGDFVAALFGGIMPYCPLCLFTHPSALWVRCSTMKECNAQHCANCGATVLRVYITKK
jgi:hypothetical protein